MKSSEVLFPEDKPRPQLRTRKLSSYTPEPVNWLWNQRIPRGKISVLAGDGGEGKSFATLGIAACVTTGRALPLSAALPPGNVLIWNGEDGPADTIVIRAKNAEADLDRIEIIEETTFKERRRPFLLRDVPLLSERILEDPELAFVVIDPITALLAGVDSHRDGEIRGALQPLADVAAATGVAVLLVMHLKKGEETNSLHRVSGSVAFGALARSVMLLGTHAESGRKSIDTVKHNLARGKPDPIEFILGEDGFRWVGPAPDLTAEAIRISKVIANRGRRGEGAKAYLEEILANGPLDSRFIWRGASERGISEVTLKRAKADLQIIAKKHGIGEGSCWTWALPDAAEIQQRGAIIRPGEFHAPSLDKDEAFDSLMALEARGIFEG